MVPSVPKRVFETKRIKQLEAAEYCTQRGVLLHNEEFYILYSSTNVGGVFKLRRIRWVGHIIRIGDEKLNLIDCILVCILQ
jgi:hypothetical protein